MKTTTNSKALDSATLNRATAIVLDATRDAEIADSVVVARLSVLGLDDEQADEVIGELLDLGIVRATVTEAPSGGFIPMLCRAA